MASSSHHHQTMMAEHNPGPGQNAPSIVPSYSNHQVTISTQANHPPFQPQWHHQMQMGTQPAPTATMPSSQSFVYNSYYTDQGSNNNNTQPYNGMPAYQNSAHHVDNSNVNNGMSSNQFYTNNSQQVNNLNKSDRSVWSTHTMNYFTNVPTSANNTQSVNGPFSGPYHANNTGPTTTANSKPPYSSSQSFTSSYDNEFVSTYRVLSDHINSSNSQANSTWTTMANNNENNVSTNNHNHYDEDIDEKPFFVPPHEDDQMARLKAFARTILKYDSSSGLFKCNFCIRCHELQFDHETDGMEHVWTYHKNIRPYRCFLCAKEFGYRTERVDHFNLMHRDIRPFKCAICGLGFNHFKQLVKHQSSCNVRM